MAGESATRFIKQRRWIFPAFCFVLCMAAGLAGWLKGRGEKGIVLQPKKDNAVGAVVGYSQKNPEWAEDKLGDSPYKMAGSGCLTSCIASALSSQQEATGIGKKVTAGELNHFFSQKEVYNEQGDLVWSRLEEAMPEITVLVASSVKQTEIESLLAKGYYPIVKVKVGGHGAFHWVMLAGSRDGEYICMDPLKENGELVSLKTHGNMVYRMRCVYWN